MTRFLSYGWIDIDIVTVAVTPFARNLEYMPEDAHATRRLHCQ